MSRAKEPNFFIEAGSFGKGVDWYRSNFADHTKICGEASPAYSKRHRHRGVPERIHRLVPRVKLIYLLRDPINRMLSHYLHNRIFGRDTRSFSEAVAAKSYRNNYVRTSMYRFQLEAFLEHFPLERILLITTEDLKDARAETLRKVFRFIGVDPHFEGSDFDRLFNQTPTPGALSADDRSGIAVSRSGRGPDVPEHPVLDRADRDRLAAHLAPDIDRLRALSGLRFERWSL